MLPMNSMDLTPVFETSGDREDEIDAVVGCSMIRETRDVVNGRGNADSMSARRWRGLHHRERKRARAGWTEITRERGSS